MKYQKNVDVNILSEYYTPTIDKEPYFSNEICQISKAQIPLHELYYNYYNNKTKKDA